MDVEIMNTVEPGGWLRLLVIRGSMGYEGSFLVNFGVNFDFGAAKKY